jgi:hypothetical protein
VKKLDESKHFFIDKKIKEEKTKYKREKNTLFPLIPANRETKSG